MKKEIISKKTIGFSLFIIFVYICTYMSPEWVMDIVNNPYSNSMLIGLFGVSTTFSLEPIINFSCGTLNVFIFLCAIPLILSLINFFNNEK